MSLKHQARSFAISKHGSQMYGDKPYYYHLDQVASILEDFGFGDEHQTVGFLHDVLEDTPTTYSDIEELFGDTIALYVSMLTDEPGKNRKERKRKTYSKIKAFELTTYVKVADRIANVTNSKNNNPKLFKMYQTEHYDFVQNLKTSDTKDHKIWEHLESLFKDEIK